MSDVEAEIPYPVLTVLCDIPYEVDCDMAEPMEAVEEPKGIVTMFY